MAAPGTPRNLYVQQGNAQVYLQWDLSAGATSYLIQRSLDGVTYSFLNSSSLPSYLDESVSVGTQYWYQVAASSSGGTSTYTTAQSVIPAQTGQVSLAQVRLMAQQRADRVGSNFIPTPEWNSYIVQSYFELYDLLTTTYEDYFVGAPYSITTDGSARYTLPTDFYKLNGVDLSLGSTDAYVTLHKFDFIERNKFVFPNITSSALGAANMRYRLMGNTLMFIPTPSAGQTLQVWYTPRLQQPLADTDMLDGVNGWIEYVVCDAAIKALQKEESDVSVLAAEKDMLRKRIEESAQNRDAGMPDSISDVRRNANSSGWSDGEWS